MIVGKEVGRRYRVLNAKQGAKVNVVRHVVVCMPCWRMLRVSGLPGRRKGNRLTCMYKGGFDG
jgi:hypothetical protein